ncbi:MAG TPA: polyprenyl synthetase family protein [Planctomycetaceae bacterium]
MVRPALVVLAARAIRDADLPWEPIYDVAAAAELIHVASLIHDDVIDRAPTRRSVSSVNGRWGNHTAVLTGDYLFARAFRLLEGHAARGMVSLMTEAIAAMCEGEALQKEQAYDPLVTEEAYIRRIEGKTAALLAACCEAGARLAGADDAAAKALRTFGLKTGIAYQIVDDSLDLVGSGEVIGKPAGSDLRQGILTLPVILLMEDPAWRRRVRALIHEGRLDDHAVEVVRSGAVETGALHRARQVAEATAEEAVEHLHFAGCRGEAVAALSCFSREAVHRLR